MKIINNILLLAVSCLTLFMACHKADDENNTTDPVLSITSPASNASISGVVTITGLATDNSLHEMHLKITKDADGSVLMESAPTVHDLTEYTIAQTWTPTNITVATPVTLTVTVEDHNEHAVTKTVNFTVNP